MIGVSVLYSDPSVHAMRIQSEGPKLQCQPGKIFKTRKIFELSVENILDTKPGSFRKTSNFPPTEAIRNVDYRSSSILKM